MTDFYFPSTGKLNRAKLVEHLLKDIEGEFTVEDVVLKAKGKWPLDKTKARWSLKRLVEKGTLEKVNRGAGGRMTVYRKAEKLPEGKPKVGPNQQEIICAKCGETKIIGKHNPSLHCYDCQKVACFSCGAKFRPNRISVSAARVYCYACRTRAKKVVEI